jgi:hypothetical protein
MKMMISGKMMSGRPEAVKSTPIGRLLGAGFFLLLFLMLFGLTACYYHTPYRTVVQPLPQDKAGNANTSVAQIYFYPKAGQTSEKLDRDRYECHNWAVKQTGFDPSLASVPPEQRVVTMVPVPPPGYDTTVLGVTGAVLGAILAGPRHAAGGALLGGAAGLIAGSASDSARQESAQHMEQAYARENQKRNAQLEEKALEYRRAMSACLEGRGYSVQ